jgi:hydrogenase expression/formation protein HypE
MSVDFEQLLCPIAGEDDTITLAHGAGGKQSANLIEKVFVKQFLNPHLGPLQDSAVLNIGDNTVAFTTDSYVINPLFFHGGDIGSLAVTGTVNDLAMLGAKPLYLSLSVIIEEGFSQSTLKNIAASIADTAKHIGVEIVTGDTKVVEAGKGDGLYINTAGIGIIMQQPYPCVQRIRTGDVLIVSNDIGRHGCAVMAKRQGLNFDTELGSDAAPLNHVVEDLLDQGMDLHCLRDLTRGGLATCAIELANGAGLNFDLLEEKIPTVSAVNSLCNILGLDPMYVANEGCMLLVVAQSDAEKTLSILRTHSECLNAAIIGGVVDGKGNVVLTTPFGTKRRLDKLSGEQLPRIC